VLRASPVLGALDLLSIIAATGGAHHRVIAERRGLTPEVRQALRISADRALAATLDDIEATSGTATPPAARPAASLMPRTTAAAKQPKPPLPESVLPGPPPQPPVLATPIPAEPALPPGVRAQPAWTTPRESLATRSVGRLDPWTFLGLERPARLRMMAELATRPPIRRYGGPSGRVDRAFRAILSAAQIVGLARSGEHQRLIDAIAGGLDLDADLVRACIEDGSGEALAVLLKSLGLDNVQAQQVFLLATPKIGRDVTTFFRLCDIYAGMEPSVAEALTEAWRESRTGKGSRHVPHFAENGDRARSSAGETTRVSSPAAAERKTLGSSGSG
jgi:uncharacterized protein (DUF2336 family)